MVSSKQVQKYHALGALQVDDGRDPKWSNQQRHDLLSDTVYRQQTHSIQASNAFLQGESAPWLRERRSRA
jgi:hypothetical protein